MDEDPVVSSEQKEGAIGSCTEETELEYFFTLRECASRCSSNHDGKRITSQKHEKEK
jgi:hypothetical protein